MNRTVIIVSGGSIHDSFATKFIKEVNPMYIIGVDSGLNFLQRNQILPTHIVGDFDSVQPDVIRKYKEDGTIPIYELNPVKDASDTEVALRLALELGVEKIWILGATGSRLDHVMANIQILKIAMDAGVKAWLVDEYNQISLWEKEIHIHKSECFGTYFSLFPFGNEVKDVSIEGAKYPLFQYHMTNCESRCVSNECCEEEVVITFSEGTMILIETRE